MSESRADESSLSRHSEPEREPLSAELDAEIADHLALSARDLVTRGEPVDAAPNAALARFGDIARIKRQCWWIQQGDEVMLRAAVVSLALLIVVGLAIVSVGGWQMRQNLDSLLATQQSLLELQRPPEITGRAYLADPSHPAKNVEIKVYRFTVEPATPTGSVGVRQPGLVTRRLRTDAEGRFRSGPLQSGDYCLLSPVLDPAGKADDDRLAIQELQSRPLFPMTGGGVLNVDLDVSASATLRISCAETVPDWITIGEQRVPVYVAYSIDTESHNSPLPPSKEEGTEQWPVAIGYSPTLQRVFDPSKSTYWWQLPPRTYPLDVRIVLGWPVAISDGKRPELTGVQVAFTAPKWTSASIRNPDAKPGEGMMSGMGGGMATTSGSKAPGGLTGGLSGGLTASGGGAGRGAFISTRVVQTAPKSQKFGLPVNGRINLRVSIAGDSLESRLAALVEKQEQAAKENPPSTAGAAQLPDGGGLESFENNPLVRAIAELGSQIEMAVNIQRGM